MLSQEFYELEGTWTTLSERRSREPVEVPNNVLDNNVVAAANLGVAFDGDVESSLKQQICQELQAKRLVVHPACRNPAFGELKEELQQHSLEDLLELKSRSLSMLTALVAEIVQRCEHLEWKYHGAATKLRCAELQETVEFDTLPRLTCPHR